MADKNRKRKLIIGLILGGVGVATLIGTGVGLGLSKKEAPSPAQPVDKQPAKNIVANLSNLTQVQKDAIYKQINDTADKTTIDNIVNNSRDLNELAAKLNEANEKQKSEAYTNASAEQKQKFNEAKKALEDAIAAKTDLTTPVENKQSLIDALNAAKEKLSSSTSSEQPTNPGNSDGGATGETNHGENPSNPDQENPSSGESGGSNETPSNPNGDEGSTGYEEPATGEETPSQPTTSERILEPEYPPVDMLSEEETNRLTENAKFTITNQGYFPEEGKPVVLQFVAGNEELKPEQFKWYSNDSEFSVTDKGTLEVFNNQIGIDSNFQLEVIGTYNGKKYVKKLNVEMVHKVNPLQNVKLTASNDGLLINNAATVTASNVDGVDWANSSWYRYTTLIENEHSTTLNVNRDGDYSLVVKNSAGVMWRLKPVTISALPLANNTQPFRSLLSNRLDIVSYTDKIIDRKTRPSIQKQVYDTKLNQMYSSYGFRYPGYDFNYEKDNRNFADRAFFEVNGKKLSMGELVYNERVEGVIGVDGFTGEGARKYSDANFIKEEIANNRLKKHPAADKWFERVVTDETQTVTKEISINTSMTGYNVIGLYAPAGEVIEFEISEDTYKILKELYGTPNETTGIYSEVPFDFYVNKSYWDNYPADNTGKISNRYPFVLSRFRFRFNEIDPVTRRVKLGSPFGGALSINVGVTLRDQNGNPAPFDVKVYNAVEQLHYVYGQTTKAEWDAQMDAVKAGTINAPIMTIQSNYTGIAIPYTSSSAIAHVKFDDIIFPEEKMHKWDSFYEMSYFWFDYNAPKLALNYCDDVWGGAGAWGGGYNLWAPIGWASPYLKGASDFGFDDWGNYHEINHNFQPHQDPFNVRDHGWTNIPSVINLSFINDKTRLRGITNPSGDFDVYWARLANSYSINQTKADWYALYSNMIYTLGPVNFIEWVKSSGRNGLYDKKLKTTWYLSKYFKLNFYYALKQYASTIESLQRSVPTVDIANDHKPEFDAAMAEANKATAEFKKVQADWKDWRFEGSKEIDPNGYYGYNDADRPRNLTEMDKQWAQKERDAIAKLRATGDKIKELMAKYPDQENIERMLDMFQWPSFDFVANIYACGQFLYNSELDRFEYTSDAAPAYQIPAGQDFTFDFANGINSLNSNFRIKELKFPARTKLGGSLEFDPSDPTRMKVIYRANPDKLAEIDEFDMEVIPADFENKPKRYVPAYRYKIKLRNVVNRPVLTTYQLTDGQVKGLRTISQIMNYIKTNNIQPKDTLVEDFEQRKLQNPFTGKKQLVESKAKFIAPETGSYNIKAYFSNWGYIKIGDAFEGEINSTNNALKDFGTVTLQKGQVYDLTITAWNDIAYPRRTFWLEKINDTGSNTIYEINNYALSPYLPADWYDTPEKIQELLTGEQWQYKPRFMPTDTKSDLQITKFAGSSQVTNPVALSIRGPSNRYINGNTDYKAIYDQIYNTKIETWQTDKLDFNIKFQKPATLSFMDIIAKADFQKQYRPTHYTIELKRTEKVEVFEGEFIDMPVVFKTLNFVVDPTKDTDGLPLTNRLDFGAIYDGIEEVHITTMREPINDDEKTRKLKVTIIREIKFGLDTQNKRVLPINNSEIQFYGTSWEFLTNENDQINNAINGVSAKVSKANEYFEFTFNSDAIDLFGKTGPNMSSFDVYIDDELVLENVSAVTTEETYNHCLLTLFTPEKYDLTKDHKMKIVNKENKPLFFNYILTK
ncbi:M60 family metallopeptidase [Mycoplasma sp. 2045]|uniref:M60 family metallopeptidase n=1 Tax=Mycoplasma sp. 2045 TaxID=2967301 RepID=UPI00211BC3A8|nr:M60 family metallopeptidase [Mycoplasma sp. 2045]UUM20687.1 M60 family metallopeptidase [Mycoplasma sp. 2045]